MKLSLTNLFNAMFSFASPRADSAALQSSARAPLSARNHGGSALPRAAHANVIAAAPARPTTAAPASMPVHRPRALSAVAGLRSGAGAVPASAVPTPPTAAASSAAHPPSASSSSAVSGTHSARGSAFDSVSAFVASLPSALRPDTKRAVHAARRAQSAVGAAPARASADYYATDSSAHSALALAQQQWAQPRAPSAGAAYRTAVLSSIPALRAGAGGGSGTGEAEDVPSGRGGSGSAVRWSTTE